MFFECGEWQNSLHVKCQSIPNQRHRIGWKQSGLMIFYGWKTKRYITIEVVQFLKEISEGEGKLVVNEFVDKINLIEVEYVIKFQDSKFGKNRVSMGIILAISNASHCTFLQRNYLINLIVYFCQSWNLKI